MAYKPGAGFLIYRKFKDGIKFLGLKGPASIRKLRNGTWDFPKGQKELGETNWDCAVREAFEECGIFVIESDIRHGPLEISTCAIFLIETTNNPVITKNPVSGLFEHEGYKWCTPDELEEDCYKWLKPFVQWGREYLKI